MALSELIFEIIFTGTLKKNEKKNNQFHCHPCAAVSTTCSLYKPEIQLWTFPEGIWTRKSPQQLRC